MNKYKSLVLCIIAITGLSTAMNNCGRMNPVTHEDVSAKAIYQLDSTKPKPTVQLGGRRYVFTTMMQVFSPPEDYQMSSEEASVWTNVQNAARTDIRHKSDIFGESCQFTRDYHDCGHDRNMIIGTLSKSVLGKSEILRHAQKIKVCEKVMSEDLLVRWMIQKISEHNRFLSENMGHSFSSLETAFDLFYPGHEMSTELEAALQTLSNEVQSQSDDGALDGMRSILLALCESTGWESI